MKAKWARIVAGTLLSACLALPAFAEPPAGDEPAAPKPASQQSPTRPGIDLSHWKLTLPVDEAGKPDGKAVEVSPSRLTSGYTSADFFYVDEHGSLVFRCPVSGAKTKSAKYPRSELREMLDPGDAAVNWPLRGTHLLDARCQVNEVPSSQKIIIGQIHSYSGEARPLVKLQYSKGRIEALVKISPSRDEDRKLTLAEVGLNRDIAYQIKLHDGVLSVTVNGQTQTADVAGNDAEWAKQTFYFKAGAYVQDNEGPATELARVTFSRLEARHVDRSAPAKDDKR
jgi:hypothetical protein